MGTIPPGLMRRTVRAAARLLASGRLPALLAAAAALLRRRGLAPLRRDVAAMLRMVRETVAGRYRPLPRRTLLAVLAGLVYLVNPLDVVADVLPLVGLVDDVVVLAWVAQLVRRDLDAFLAWEQEWGGAIDVEALSLDDPPCPDCRCVPQSSQSLRLPLQSS